MSVSTLTEIEACPRRWALSAADYPELWDRHGYPPHVFMASLAGSVVHLVLESLVKALVCAGCTSVDDADAVQTMRSLGGYSKLINDCIEYVLERYAGNPRVASLLEAAARSLRSRVPEMRTEIQAVLGRVKLHMGHTGPAKDDAGSHYGRAPLGPGSYPELELRARGIGWRGTVDLLMLSDSKCEIVDFKTGAQDDSHRFQVRVYALLWARDSELNPTGRVVDRLTLAYPSGDVQIDPPKVGEIGVIERDLLKRGQIALNAVSARPPEARPSAENCRFCGVRHLCEEYWQPATARAVAPADLQVSSVDLQFCVTARHGPLSWDGVVELSPAVAPGKQIVLRTTSQDIVFERGDRIRVLDAYMSGTASNDESQPAVATMTAVSEVFLLAGARRGLS